MAVDLASVAGAPANCSRRVPEVAEPIVNPRKWDMAWLSWPKRWPSHLAEARFPAFAGF
jgi:hypothetical protein